jgi:hypothetical protein
MPPLKSYSRSLSTSTMETLLGMMVGWWLVQWTYSLMFAAKLGGNVVFLTCTFYLCQKWGKLHNLYSSPNIIRQIKSRTRWARHVACMGQERYLYKILVWKPKGKRSLGRPRHRWEDGIRMDLRGTGGGVEWIKVFSIKMSVNTLFSN